VTSFVTEALTREHDRTAFRCGVEALDRYLREFALQDMRRRVSGCFIALDDGCRIIGFYTLAATSVAIDALPPEVTRRLPPYPLVPAVIMGRLAVATEYQGQSLGRALIIDAAIRIDRMRLGAFAMIVDSKDDRVLAFYRTNGFTLLPGETRRLFAPLVTLLRGQHGG
jgi:ribosomal protein S18 acetylase RimI-like enzyme